MVIRSFNGNTFLRAARNVRPNFWVIESAARVAICRHGNRHADDLHPLGELSIVPPRSYRADRGTSHCAAFMREDMARHEQAVRTLNLQQPK
jgi:hypothetical protein